MSYVSTCPGCGKPSPCVADDPFGSFIQDLKIHSWHAGCLQRAQKDMEARELVELRKRKLRSKSVYQPRKRLMTARVHMPKPRWGTLP